MFGLGLPELIIVGVIAVMLFGRRLPEVARSFGQSYQQFRAGLNDIQSEVNSATRDVNRPLYQPTPAITYDDHASEEMTEGEQATADESESDSDGARLETQQALADHEAAQSGVTDDDSHSV